MIETINGAPQHVAALRIAGTVTAEEYDTVIHEVDAKLAANDRINVFVEAVGFEDFTPEALNKRVKYGASKLGELHRFGRIAAVTDKQWMRAWVGLADRLLPQIEVRAFDPAERDRAMAWVSERT